MDRKDFIKSCGLVCLGTTAFSLLESCASANYFAANIFSENKVVIKKSEFVKIEKEKRIPRKYVLVKSEKLNFPICIFQIAENKYSAVLMECTHKGCELHTQGDYLICPCHGSEFTNTGVVQNPPAEQNLKTFIITSDNENIYVQL
jgi:cytochrome b6-f complex iron-sulfur subunit